MKRDDYKSWIDQKLQEQDDLVLLEQQKEKELERAVADAFETTIEEARAWISAERQKRGLIDPN